MSASSQLTIDVRPGEQLLLDGRRIVVELLDKSGKLARLRVTAPRDVAIEREGVGDGGTPAASPEERAT